MIVSRFVISEIQSNKKKKFMSCICLHNFNVKVKILVLDLK